ncbi:MAG: flagellar protein FlgN [Lachnospiraceae bacterium]|nr:flagellar protein FlgN [Lachnospiraceae bacterium]
MSREYVVALKESLDKKLKVLEEIYRISKLQTDVINAQQMDYEAFDRLVDDKDICLEKLEKLDEGFELVYTRVSDELKTNKSAYSDLILAMQETITKITDKSTAISALEERNRQGLSNVFNKERKELSDGKRSVNVAMNYYKNMTGLSVESSQYMDWKK